MNTKEIKKIEIEFEYFTREGVEDCKQCLDQYAPPHFNCLYIDRPNAIGHDKGQSGHCTAKGCY
jgi:hypothetical protein